MAHSIEQLVKTTELRKKMLIIMSKPVTTRQIAKLCEIHYPNAQYHINILVAEGFVKTAGKCKIYFTKAFLYKAIVNMPVYVMQPRNVNKSKEKLISHKPIQHPNARTFYLFGDAAHFVKMNASKTKAKLNYYVNGSTLSGAF